MVSQVFQAVDHFDQTYQHYKQCCVESQQPGTQDVEVVYQRCTESYRQVKQEGRSLLGKTSNLSFESRKLVSEFLSTLKEKRHVQKKQALPSSSSALIRFKDPNLELLVSPSFIAQAKEQCDQLCKVIHDRSEALELQYNKIQSIYPRLLCEAANLFKADKKKIKAENYLKLCKNIQNKQKIIQQYRFLFTIPNMQLLDKLKSIHNEVSMGTFGKLDTQEKVNNIINAARVEIESHLANAEKFLAEQRKIAKSIVI